MNKIVIANWNLREEFLGGQESFFFDLSKIFNAKRVSYTTAENVLRYNLFSDVFRIVYRGYVIEKYLKQYGDLFKPDLIIKNSGIGGFVELETPQVIVFQDPFYNIMKKMIENGAFSPNLEHYSACIELQRRTAKNAKTVAVSNFMKKDMELCGIKCDKIIEEGVDIEKFKPLNKRELRKKYGIPSDKKIGIAVTKFIPQKGWDILAMIISAFQDIHWIVILTDITSVKPKLKNVTLLERVAPELMQEIYNCADFFINTSPVESFGLSPIEAASCNLPLIVYKTGFAWNWWDNRLGLRVNKWDYESFEKAVKNLGEGYEPRKVIIERGFTLERMKEDWKEFVENLLKNK